VSPQPVFRNRDKAPRCRDNALGPSLRGRLWPQRKQLWSLTIGPTLPVFVLATGASRPQAKQTER
jgi:hypothetical protein